MNGLYVAASGAASEVNALDLTAQNIANTDTPGFRRLLGVEQSLDGSGTPYQYSSVGPPQLDLRQGPLRATGNPLDVAVTGTAFIAVATADGTAYTRNGELQVAPDGTLMAAGNPVAGAGGAPIILSPGAVTIGRDGSVMINGTPAGKITLADPAGATMTPLGASLYRATNDQVLPPAGAESQLHQGYLEGAAGARSGAIGGLLSGLRNYEAAMKAVQAIDENQQQAIQTFTLQA